MKTLDAIQHIAALGAGGTALVTNGPELPPVPGLRILQFGNYLCLVASPDDTDRLDLLARTDLVAELGGGNFSPIVVRGIDRASHRAE